MDSILFVCTGNINRSPAAEIIMRRRLEAIGLGRIHVSSAALSDKRPGQLMTLPMTKTLQALGYMATATPRPRSKVLTLDALAKASLVVGMTENHLKRLESMASEASISTKALLLSAFCTPKANKIPDPHFDGTHARAAALITDGCSGLARHVVERLRQRA